MSPMALVFRYSAFAVLATLANLGTQRLVLSMDDGAAGFALAVFLGTMVGLVLKYLLDKQWIFNDRSTGIAAHGRKFPLYVTMGIMTTAIFWGMETAFWLAFHSDAMRELGAVLGLTAGYIVKYWLDRRFVFVKGAVAGSA